MDDQPELEAKLSQVRTMAQSRTSPEGLERTERANAEIAASIAPTALQVGDTAPDFSLPSAGGGQVSLGALLATGPVVLSFYRGHW